MSRLPLFVSFLLLAFLLPSLTVAEIDRHDVYWAVSEALPKQGRLTTYLTQGNRLVVVDGDKRSIALYDLTGDTVRLVSQRGLDDREIGPVRTPQPAVMAAIDVPGDDPPGAPRLDGWVRVRADKEIHDSKQKWSATYYAPGEIDDLYRSLEAALEGWTIRSATIQRKNEWVQFEARRHSEKLFVGVNRGLRPTKDWNVIQVSVERQQP